MKAAHLSPSELILNPDGSIYHLNLLPEDIADTIITVGDQDRVDKISRFFDTVEVQKQKREFKTHTGTYRGKRLTVLSTGIGPDNIDIVMNELDALVNINFNTRTIREEKKSLTIVRVGTSGSLQAEIPVGSFVAAEMGLGFDNLLHFYKELKSINDLAFTEAFIKHTHWNSDNSKPYAIAGDASLREKFTKRNDFFEGVTATNVGFYGPQGRVLRLAVQDTDLNDKVASFNFEGKKITNFEMETAAIYGMASLLGHKALSLNAIIANRADGTFSEDPKKDISTLISRTLRILTE